MGINFKVRVLTPKKYSTKNKKFKIHSVKNKHSKMDSFGYICYFKTKSFYYSGDCCNINKKALRLFLNNKIDEFYHEVCEKKSKVHTCIDDLKHCIPYTKRNNVYLMHFFKNSVEDYKRYGFNIANEL